jgi:SAM-dependent methyltransferase
MRHSPLPPRLLEADVNWAPLKPEEFQWMPCLLCGSPNYKSLASMVINWSEFFLVQCDRCNLIWRNPMPDGRFLSDLYSEKYFNVAEHSPDLIYQVGIADADEKSHQMRREKTAQEVEDWIARGITPRTADGQQRRLLEIGGGRGYLQLAAQKKGWDTIGVEISPHGIKSAIANGFVVLPIPLDQLCEQYLPHVNYFDLVVFFDFIEHVTDPGLVLRMIRFTLKDEGHIILRVPNTSGTPKLHLIDHICHFSPETLSLLLEREGFDVVESHHSGVFLAPSGDRIENLTVTAQKRKKKA